MYSYSYLRAVNLHGMNNDEGRSPLFSVKRALSFTRDSTMASLVGNVPVGLHVFTVIMVGETFQLNCESYPVDGLPQELVDDVNVEIAQVSETQEKCFAALQMIVWHFQDMR